MIRRKHHAACVINNLMLVQGGIDSVGHVIDEFVIFDLESNDYKPVECEGDNLGPLAGHRFVTARNAFIKK